MTKEEFLERTPGTEKPTQEQWDIIETVYNYHPSISETNGKSQIAYLYVGFGFRVIKDMYPTANKAKEIITKMQIMKAKLEFLKDKLQEL